MNWIEIIPGNEPEERTEYLLYVWWPGGGHLYGEIYGWCGSKWISDSEDCMEYLEPIKPGHKAFYCKIDLPVIKEVLK